MNLFGSLTHPAGSGMPRQHMISMCRVESARVSASAECCLKACRFTQKCCMTGTKRE